MVSDLRIVPLARGYDRTGFDCGIEALNRYLRQQARQDGERRFSRTYILTAGSGKQILAYYTLCAGEVACDLLPADVRAALPRYPMPVVRLCRLAVDGRHHGRHFGSHILVDALRRTVRSSEELGVHAVVVDAKNEAASEFLLKYGFLPLLDDAKHLYLPLTTAVMLFKDWQE
jgi:ribosomal protein S18 acetylase RimI-like enzyme